MRTKMEKTNVTIGKARRLLFRVSTDKQSFTIAQLLWNLEVRFIGF